MDAIPLQVPVESKEKRKGPVTCKVTGPFGLRKNATKINKISGITGQIPRRRSQTERAVTYINKKIKKQLYKQDSLLPVEKTGGGTRTAGTAADKSANGIVGQV